MPRHRLARAVMAGFVALCLLIGEPWTSTISASDTLWTGPVRSQADVVGFKLGADGVHHVLLRSAAPMWPSLYGNDAGGAWHFEGFWGAPFDLELDPSGSPVILTGAIDGTTYQPVNVYRWVNGGWVQDPVPAYGPSDAGRVAVGDDGRVHVIWRNHGWLTYAVKTEAGWSEAQTIAVAHANNDITVFPEMTLDNDGDPHIFESVAFVPVPLGAPCTNTACLIEVTQDGLGGWHLSPVAAVYGPLATATDGSGDPVFAIAGENVTWYVQRSSTGWSTETVMAGNGYDASVAIGPSGPVVFKPLYPAGFRRADRTSAGWTVTTVNTVNSAGVATVDSLGRSHIMYAMTVSDPKLGTYPSVFLQAPDHVAPIAGVPQVEPRVGSTISATVPIRVSWSGSDTISGVSRYQLQQKTGTGAWFTVGSTLTTTTAIRALTPLVTYQFRVRAFDKAGNVGAFRYGPPVRIGRSQGTSSSITYRGTWRTQMTSSASGGSTKYSTARNATATIRFTGSSFGWVSAKSRTRGSARVYVDGAWVATVSLYRSSTLSRDMVYGYRWPTVGPHTIKIVAIGTSGHPRVDLDAFVYTR